MGVHVLGVLGVIGVHVLGVIGMIAWHLLGVIGVIGVAPLRRLRRHWRGPSFRRHRRERLRITRHRRGWHARFVD